VEQARKEQDAVAASSPFVGRSIERLEDAALLTGHGLYADDAGVRPGTLHAAIVRSPHGHANVKAIDVSAALTMPGVRAVLTGEDVRQWAAPFVVGVKQPMEHWCIAMERVRYVGEPVVVIMAENRYLAEDAAEKVRVEYEVLSAVVDPEAAAEAAAPLLHDAVGSNVVSERHFVYGDPAQAFANAAREVSIKIHYPRNTCTPIECYVVQAEYLSAEQGYEVLSNFQGPFALHPVMALALKIPGSRLRLQLPRDSGGSFGVKQGVFPYIVLMCLAARKAGAPVKWVEDRLEHLQAATSATNRVTTISAAVSADGIVNALRYDQLDDCGGYLRAPEPATFYRMHGCLTGAYRTQHLEVRNRVVLTNKTPAGLVRGFGGPQVYFALERLMHKIAVELNLDPLEVIRRNLIAAGSFPYKAPAGALLDSGDYQKALQLAEDQGDLAGLRRRRDEARQAGRLYGIGYAAIVEPSISNMGYITTALTAAQRAKAGPKGGANASATVSIDALGGVSVVIASAPQGQGHRTVCAQVVADALGLTPREVAVNAELDTQKDAWSIASGNYSSRFAGAVAGTVHLAAMKLREKLALIAADMWKVEPAQISFKGGKVSVADDPQRMIAFHRLAGTAHWSPGSLPESMMPGMRETVFWNMPELTPPDDNDVINSSGAYGFVFDVCGVEVDPATGRIRIDRYITTHDAGRILHPGMADGQVRGAFAQAVGAAFMEEFAYGSDGSFLSGTLADYLLPTAMEVPEPQIIHLETPSPFTPLGAKGLGEGNNMSTPVCIANAVADALGQEDIRLPLTPARVIAMLDPPDPPPRGQSAAPAAVAPKTHGGRSLAMRGEIDLPATPEEVYAVLLDPQALARVIPGCHAMESVGENQYRADITLGIGVVKARYAAQVQLSELNPPHSLRLAGRGSSSLGEADGSGSVTLQAIAGGTRLTYDYDVAVGGKVAAVGSRMLEGAAKIILRQLFEQLGKQARREPGASSASSPAASGGLLQKLRSLFGSQK
jgi:2-furoyl-CoA dehydrogenase large subunit